MPKTTKPKKFLLDPNESALENVWRCARATTCFVMQRWWRKLRLTEDERDELFSDIIIASVVAFLVKVRSGRYDRRYPLWQNMFSCTWGCSSNVIDRHLARIRKKLCERSIYEPMGDSGATYLDMMEDTGTPALNYRHQLSVSRPHKSSEEYRKELESATGKKAENIRRRLRDAIEREKEESAERTREFRVALGLEEA